MMCDRIAEPGTVASGMRTEVQSREPDGLAFEDD